MLYDQFADRWILTQLAPAIFGADGNHQCIAVSTSGDPLGSYYLYDYLYGDALNDYPKFGMWPDAYYMTAREFGGEGRLHDDGHGVRPHGDAQRPAVHRDLRERSTTVGSTACCRRIWTAPILRPAPS